MLGARARLGGRNLAAVGLIGETMMRRVLGGVLRDGRWMTNCQSDAL